MLSALMRPKSGLRSPMTRQRRKVAECQAPVDSARPRTISLGMSVEVCAHQSSGQVRPTRHLSVSVRQAQLIAD